MSGSNVRKAQQFLLAKGWAPHQVAGIVGNLMQESGRNLKTNAIGDGGNSYGVAQWNGPRRRALEAFAIEEGMNKAALETQLEFLDHELRTSESAAGKALAAAADVDEAARVFSEKFERPGVPVMKNRIRNARAVLGIKGGPIPDDPQPQVVAAGGGADALLGGEDSIDLDALVDSTMDDMGALEGAEESLDLDALVDSTMEEEQSGLLQTGDLAGLGLAAAAGPLGPVVAGALPFIPQGIKDAAGQVAQGATFGFGDEATGAANALISPGADIGEAQARFAGEQRARDEQYADENPIASTALQVAGAGGVAAPLMGLGAGANLLGRAVPAGANLLGRTGITAPASAALANLLGRAGIMAGEGAALGAVQGAGDAAPGERLEGAARGAAGGAALGAALPVAGAALKPVVGPALRAGGRFVSNMLGISDAEKKAADLINRALEADDALKIPVPGKPSTVLDIAGPATRQLGQTAVAVPSKGASAATEFLENRVASQGNRIARSADEFFGSDGKFAEGVSEILERRSAQTKPLYAKLNRESIPMGKPLIRLLKFDAARAAFQKAIVTTEATMGRKLTALRKALDSGELEGVRVPFRVIDNTKKIFDSMIRFDKTPQGAAQVNEAGSKIASGLGLKRLRARLLDYADSRFKGYAGARRVSADEAALVDAAQDGQKFMRGDADQLVIDFKALSEAEKEAFRMGAASHVRNIVEGMADGADAANKLIRSKALRRRFLALSDSPSDFKKLMRELRAENQFGKTRNDVLKGSQTAKRQTAEDALTSAADLGETFAMGGRSGATNALIRGLFRRARGLDEKTASRVSELLTSNDIPGVLNMLKDRKIAAQVLTRENLSRLPPEFRRALSRAITANQAPEVIP